MAFRKNLGLTALLLSSFMATAEPIQINPSHPDQYTVVPGDNLWDISEKFLQHPWQWPELWQNNSQIQNPHLIYPGDTIYFSLVNGRPQLSLSRDWQASSMGVEQPCVLNESEYKNGRSSFALDSDGKVLPCIRVSEYKKAIEIIPSDRIAKYLSSPKVLSENQITLAPYVVDLADEHLVVGAGDRIYVRAIKDSPTRSFTVYRAGDTYKNPVTGEVLGYEAKYIAEATLVAEGDPATLEIDKSDYEIGIGDRIMPNGKEDLALHYFPRPPEKPVQGNIISLMKGVSQVGQFDAVVIDKGLKDGLQIGHQLDIYNKGRTARDSYSKVTNDSVELPDEYAGKLMVFRTFERVSYALVMKAKHAVHAFDKVKSPERFK